MPSMHIQRSLFRFSDYPPLLHPKNFTYNFTYFLITVILGLTPPPYFYPGPDFEVDEKPKGINLSNSKNWMGGSKRINPQEFCWLKNLFDATH